MNAIRGKIQGNVKSILDPWLRKEKMWRKSLNFKNLKKNTVKTKSVRKEKNRMERN
jgi:hypothetical protein